jgi:hypothetical protein
MTTENLNGLGTSQNPAAGEPADGQEPDYVLSEETLHKLSPETRAIGARLLRLERENAQLRVQAQQSEDGYDDDDEPAAQPTVADRDAKLKAVLDNLIPDDGYEAITPGLKKVLTAIIRENEELRSTIDKQETRFASSRQEDMWESWKGDHEDWTKYDEQMNSHFKELGTRPTSKRQLTAVYNLLKDAGKASTLERELATERKSGAAPRMGSATPSLRNRLANGGAKGTARNMNELFARHFVPPDGMERS